MSSLTWDPPRPPSRGLWSPIYARAWAFSSGLNCVVARHASGAVAEWFGFPGFTSCHFAWQLLAHGWDVLLPPPCSPGSAAAGLLIAKGRMALKKFALTSKSNPASQVCAMMRKYSKIFRALWRENLQVSLIETGKNTGKWETWGRSLFCSHIALHFSNF